MTQIIFPILVGFSKRFPPVVNLNCKPSDSKAISTVVVDIVVAASMRAYKNIKKFTFFNSCFSLSAPSHLNVYNCVDLFEKFTRRSTTRSFNRWMLTEYPWEFLSFHHILTHVTSLSLVNIWAYFSAADENFIKSWFTCVYQLKMRHFPFQSRRRRCKRFKIRF